VKVVDVIDKLHQFKIFAELDPAGLEAVAQIARVQEYGTGEQVMVEEAEADNLYLIVSGSTVVKMRTPEGREILIDEVGPGQFLGWSAVVPPHVYIATATATEPTEVIVVPGQELRRLFEADRYIGYKVTKGIGEVMSRRFGKAIGRYDVDELRRFNIFAELDRQELDAIGRIAHVREYDTGEKLTTEGTVADQLYLFLKGRAVVKVRSPEGQEVLIDQVAPGELLGWSAAMEPHVYTASSWTVEPSEVIVIPGRDLRELCEANKHIGYEVAKGIGEVISRRFGQAIGRHGDMRPKDLRAFGGEERVIWDDGQLQLTTEAVLIGMGSDSPDVIPLEAVFDVEVEADHVVFRAHGGDVRSPQVDDPERLASLVRDELLRTRQAHRRRGY